MLKFIYKKINIPSVLSESPKWNPALIREGGISDGHGDRITRVSAEKRIWGWDANEQAVLCINVWGLWWHFFKSVNKESNRNDPDRPRVGYWILHLWPNIGKRWIWMCFQNHKTVNMENENIFWQLFLKQFENYF